MTQAFRLLCTTQVSNQGWQAFLDTHIPPGHTHWAAPHGPGIHSRRPQACGAAAAVDRDPRVSPWTGTAHGVLQAVNTYDHYEGIVRGADRAERNSLKTLTDGYRDLDRTTLQTLNKVLEQAA